MISPETTIGKRLHIPDESLAFIYVKSYETGGLVGLEYHAFSPNLVVAEYAPHAKRYILRENLTERPQDIDYVASCGDGTSHGATWENFCNYVLPLSRSSLQMSDSERQSHIDGLLNMAAEGSNSFGMGWNVLKHALLDAQTEVAEGMGWRIHTLFEGLGYMALNYAEREEAEIGS